MRTYMARAVVIGQRHEACSGDRRSVAVDPAGELPPQVLDEAPAIQAGAGRPEGQPVWQVGPQGFIVANGADNGVVYPLWSRVDKQQFFYDLLPKSR
jgi:hypothetical protein